MDRITQVTKLDERSKYVTLWPLGRVELGGRVYYWDTDYDHE